MVDDLKQVAPLGEFCVFQPLVRTYVGQGLRVDLVRLENDANTPLIESLERHGVNEEVVNDALDEVGYRQRRNSLLASSLKRDQGF